LQAIAVSLKLFGKSALAVLARFEAYLVKKICYLKARLLRFSQVQTMKDPIPQNL
jgi:hypothetical protein